MKIYNNNTLYDCIIIGGGIAGLTAALYLARARYRVLVIEKNHFGGQITITDEVVNYPGIEKISGRELADTLQHQAGNFGAEFLSSAVTGIVCDDDDDVKTVLCGEDKYYCVGLLLATGARPRSLGFAGEEAHRGHGVAYCATCDGEFFTDCDVYVVGGGFAAAEESVFLTKYAKSVTILIREDDFTCAAAVAEPARRHDKITILTNTVVEEVRGDGRVDYIRYKNTNTGEITERKSDSPLGVFVFAGYVPESDLVRDIVSLDENGYINANADMSTDRAGIYAAGDVCVKSLRQVITAAGDGAVAATSLEKYISTAREKSGIIVPPNSRTTSEKSNELFSGETAGEISELFGKMPKRMSLCLSLDEGEASRELEKFVRSLVSLTDRIDVHVNRDVSPEEEIPCVRICHEDGTEAGISFHGIPTGHEFTPFLLGIYALSGGAKPLDDKIKKEIGAITTPIRIKIFVSLSCTMCPDTVISAGRIAAENGNVSVDVYDIRYFEDMKKKYGIMSVPCIVINDTAVSFGQKNIAELAGMIGEKTSV